MVLDGITRMVYLWDADDMTNALIKGEFDAYRHQHQGNSGRGQTPEKPNSY